MECRYCGAKLNKDDVSCPVCHNSIYTIPDYNPLDDMLAEQVKAGVNQEEKDVFSTTGSLRKKGNNTSRQTGRISDKERRRRAMEKKKAARRKRRRIIISIFLLVIVSVFVGGFFVYRNSYAGLIQRGNNAYKSGDYTEAIDLFGQAIAKNDKKPDAYTGLSDVYISQDKEDKAEEMFLNLLEEQPKNADLYRACFEFYVKIDDTLQIPILLDTADDSVYGKLSDYVVEEPTFSLDDSTVFEDVQQLTLTSSGVDICYTTDGKDPTFNSPSYEKEIQLSEGETCVKAFAVNDDGIPSKTVEKNYTVEFPIVDAPAVSPSTGQYDSEQMIEIKVPDGYTAYYTTNGTDPTTASLKYTGPITMPIGETLFKALLVDSSGRTSGITTRNYMRDN